MDWQLHGVVLGRPAPHLTWFRDGHVTRGEERCVAVSGNGVLCLPERREMGPGVYTLSASNLLGTTSRNITLSSTDLAHHPGERGDLHWCCLILDGSTRLRPEGPLCMYLFVQYLARTSRDCRGIITHE